MARKPAGPETVDKLEGSEEAKRRLRIVLETIRGGRTVEDACACLGVGATRFEELRKQALEGALAALEAKPMGRPSTAPLIENSEVARLRAENDRLKQEIVIAHVREELAIGLPRIAFKKK